MKEIHAMLWEHQGIWKCEFQDVTRGYLIGPQTSSKEILGYLCLLCGLPR